jgi:hypothetical protein
MAETATPQRTTQNLEVNGQIENKSKFLFLFGSTFQIKKQTIKLSAFEVLGNISS